MKSCKWYKRLINVIIDFFTIEFITLILLSIFKLIGMNIEQKIEIGQNIEFYSFSFFTFIFTFLFYYYIFELFTGKTLGKLITNSKVIVCNEKKRITAILYRTIFRLLIFEILWFFTGRPKGLHDILSGTIVTDSK